MGGGYTRRSHWGEKKDVYMCLRPLGRVLFNSFACPLLLPPCKYMKRMVINFLGRIIVILLFFCVFQLSFRPNAPGQGGGSCNLEEAATLPRPSAFHSSGLPENKRSVLNSLRIRQLFHKRTKDKDKRRRGNAGARGRTCPNAEAIIMGFPPTLTEPSL